MEHWTLRSEAGGSPVQVLLTKEHSENIDQHLIVLKVLIDKLCEIY